MEDVVQDPPALGNQYITDRVLQSYVKRTLSGKTAEDAEAALEALGAEAGERLHAMEQADIGKKATLKQWDAWGARIDEITVTPLWEEAERLAVEYGLVRRPYEMAHGPQSRIVQFALAHLFIPATDFYGCPLAMTDGAARTLLDSGNEALIDEALPHLTARDPSAFWTSGQWMTELSGGSDVSQTQTTARTDDDGTWRLYGRKWFTSAITAQMALALARPDGNPEGGAGLALFYVPIRDENGALNDGIRVNRLKDKLGTWKLPTAELTLDGARAIPVDGLEHGTRRISPMLNITRTWNAVTATSLMRRAVALARDYAEKREAFGEPIAYHPLHQETIADMQATYEGAFHLSFRVAELLGRREAGAATDEERDLLRVLTPVAKLLTAKQAVEVTSEALEAFGGAGYVEDTGLPKLLRDAQVLPIWEGTTNVLSLDVLRALDRTDGLLAIRNELRRCVSMLSIQTMVEPMRAAVKAFREAVQWLQAAQQKEEAEKHLQAGARRFALTLGYVMEVALTACHAQWAVQEESDGRSAAAAERLAEQKINHIARLDPHDAYVLTWDFNCPTLFECHTGSGDGAPASDTLTDFADTTTA
ncbi:acyl-CoA dehydrogenase family protein [Salisaeta longa]|uniref:acyl-CoA dehydrogenase family protein n=1 Tax=Salisaeta longa TaxID=503170 RepID=UPI0003B70C4D|nr:acyl-CoA dehydrogenase family protein [Salisaeta longa]